MFQLQRLSGNRAVADLVTQKGSGDPTACSPVFDVIRRGGGRRLDPALRGAMEASLGASFDTVRLHVDARSTESVNAQAYTVGEEIVVHPKSPDPRSREGLRLLAHELAHVVQQRQGPVSGTSTGAGIDVSDPSDRFEREAVAIADHAVAAGLASAAAPPGSTARSQYLSNVTGSAVSPARTVSEAPGRAEASMVPISVGAAGVSPGAPALQRDETGTAQAAPQRSPEERASRAIAAMSTVLPGDIKFVGRRVRAHFGEKETPGSDQDVIKYIRAATQDQVRVTDGEPGQGPLIKIFYLFSPRNRETKQRIVMQTTYVNPGPNQRLGLNVFHVGPGAGAWRRSRPTDE